MMDVVMRLRMSSIMGLKVVRFMLVIFMVMFVVFVDVVVVIVDVVVVVVEGVVVVGVVVMVSSQVGQVIVLMIVAFSVVGKVSGGGRVANAMMEGVVVASVVSMAVMVGAQVMMS